MFEQIAYSAVGGTYVGSEWLSGALKTPSRLAIGYLALDAVSHTPQFPRIDLLNGLENAYVGNHWVNLATVSAGIALVRGLAVGTKGLIEHRFK